MRITVIAIVAACLPLLAQAQDEAPLDTPKQRFSYGVGLQAARSLTQQGITEIDTAAFAAGVQDALEGRGLRVTVDQLRDAFAAYQQEVQAEKAAAGAAARARGEAFLADNAGRDGVTVLDSGLQYVVVEAGSGEQPSETDTVLVHYTGRLLDGSEFDSSYSRGQPTELQVGQVIRGWQQALQLMPVGAKWEIWIPSDLAYGPSGAGARIGPDETLNFDIELVEIKN